MIDPEALNKAFETMAAISKDQNLGFSIEYVPTKKLYRVRCMNRQFLNDNLFEAMKDCIKFVSIALGYTTPQAWEPAPIHRTDLGNLIVLYSIDKIKEHERQKSNA